MRKILIRENGKILETTYAKVVEDSAEQDRILKEIHESSPKHLGQTKMLKMLNPLFFWPGKVDDIKATVSELYILLQPFTKYRVCQHT